MKQKKEKKIVIVKFILRRLYRISMTMQAEIILMTKMKMKTEKKKKCQQYFGFSSFILNHYKNRSNNKQHVLDDDG